MYTGKLLSVKTKQRAPLINDISHRNVFFVTITVLQYNCIFVAHHTSSQTHILMNKLIEACFCIMMHLIFTFVFS